jgi:hypothetical protein
MRSPEKQWTCCQGELPLLNIQPGAKLDIAGMDKLKLLILHTTKIQKATTISSTAICSRDF